MGKAKMLGQFRPRSQNSPTKHGQKAPWQGAHKKPKFTKQDIYRADRNYVYMVGDESTPFPPVASKKGVKS